MITDLRICTKIKCKSLSIEGDSKCRSYSCTCEREFGQYIEIAGASAHHKYTESKKWHGGELWLWGLPNQCPYKLEHAVGQDDQWVKSREAKMEPTGWAQ